MDRERWRRIEALFERAFEQMPAVRDAWLKIECGEDQELWIEVREMLAADSTRGILDDLVRTAASSLIQPADPPVNRAGPYRLIRELGRGGMGTVYLGQRDDGEYDGEVAVKLIRSGMDTDFFLARFKRERQALARLQHPNIARLMDSGATSDGRPYIVMELAPGRPINEHVHAKRLSLEPILRIFIDVCRAVSHAHKRSILHRDLKPGNILVDEDGVARLLDFGICKLVEDHSPLGDLNTGAHLMTPGYASPEQVRGEAMSFASDQFSLAAVLYELLTGRMPYQIEQMTPQGILKAVCEDEILKPSLAATEPTRARHLAGDLDAVLLQALRRQPAYRYPSVADFANDLGSVLNGEPVRARPDTLRFRAVRMMARHRGAAAASVVFALAAGTIFYRLQPPAILPDTAPDTAPATMPSFLEAHRLLNNKAREGERDRLTQAAQLFEQADRERPASGPILDGLAVTYMELTELDSMRDRRLNAKVEKIARRALAVDPTLDQSHRVLAGVLLFDHWNAKAAIVEFDQAVKLNPRRTESHQLRSDTLCMLGRFDEALESVNRAQTLEPADADIATEKAMVFFHWRKFAQAEIEAQRALTLAPQSIYARWALGMAMQQQSRLAEAENEYRQIGQRHQRDLIALGHLLAVTGQRAEALTIAAQLERHAPNPYGVALIQVGLGNHQNALNRLRQALAAHDMNLLYMHLDPRFDSIRSDLSYRQLAAEVGISSR